MNKYKLGVYVASTLKHSYALKAQARALHSACVYAGISDPTIVIVSSEEDFFDEVNSEYEKLLPKGKIILIKNKEFFDCSERKNYKNEVQLMIAQMRTIGTKTLLSEGCDRILSLDSDVLPHHNSIQCMLDVLEFDKGYYSVAQCPYPSQGGGAFLGGRGTPQKHILEDFLEEERAIPKKIKKQKAKAKKDLDQFISNLVKNRIEKSPEIDQEIEKKHQKLREIDEEIKKCPPKGNVFKLNSKAWRRRGWFDYAYPAIGKGSIVPVDWVGFGCTMMNKEAASLCDFSGYNGGGTEDLFIVWNRWYPNNLNIANIAHCPSDHIIRDRGKDGKYIHIMTYHEKEGETIGHLRQKHLPWYSQDLGEEYDLGNDGKHSIKQENE